MTATITPATERQISYLTALAHDRLKGATTDQIEAAIASAIEGGRATVSTTIDQLLSLPPAPKAPEVRTNSYGGACAKCKGWVPEREGQLHRREHGGWYVTHTGECPAEPKGRFPFPEGHYAVTNEDGELAFYGVSERGIFVQAGDEFYPVAAKAWQSVIERVAADPAEASATYGREIGACGVCGRTLTSEWRERGIGPVCNRKMTEQGWG